MKASLPFKYTLPVKNGINQVVFDFKDDNGKRKRKWISTGLPEKCSKKELKARVDEIIAQFSEDYYSGKATKVKTGKVEKIAVSEAVLKNSVSKTDGEYGFTAFLDYWLETIKPTIAYTTHQGYSKVIGRIKRYFDEKFPNVLLSDVTALMIQQFYNDSYNSGLSANTVKHYHANIHKAFKYAVKMDLVQTNPTEKNRTP